MQEKIAYKKFEQTTIEHCTYQQGAEVARLSLELGKVAMRFAQVERTPRYKNGERENDAEHSFMLALVAPEIAVTLELPLDPGLIAQFATVHDLIELKTGDVATFLFSADSQLQKELDEQTMLHDLLEELPPYTANLLARYESQTESEARFVRYVDKLLPIVTDIIGEGKRVMREDYHISHRTALRQCHEALHSRLITKFEGEFPDLDLAHELLCELFQNSYSS